jgi:RND family efflux transporter MFP subunit
MIYKYTNVLMVIMLIAVLNGMPMIADAEPLQGITAPSADVTLSFVQPGRVSDVLVKAGTAVKKGQPLVQLFNEPERIESEQLKLLSEDHTKIDTAKAELAQKRADMRKLKRAHARGAASQWEVDHSILDVRIAELKLKSALVEHEQYRLKYEHSQSQLERMRLASPIAGRVEEVSVEAGESIGPLGAAVRVVQNDPLWIDVPVPITEASHLAIGQRVWVTFPGASAAHGSPNGHIIDVSAVADAASDTLHIRIEVPNTNQRPAGERVTVAFSQDGTKNQEAAQQNHRYPIAQSRHPVDLP